MYSKQIPTYAKWSQTLYKFAFQLLKPKKKSGGIFKKYFLQFREFMTMIIQWNLDLRKILGVDKIFLKSRFFLISNTGKPLKVTNIA